MNRILEPGRNCWRIEHARKLAFLVDGQAYYGALRAAVARAQRSILILGWDIDSRLRLVRGETGDGLPERLGEFLNTVVSRRESLHAHVLVWDFAMIYALERELLPLYKLDWRTHPRLHFRMNDRHPAGASQHEKIVVVDDSVAFVGGFDLGKWRWDTPEHRAVDERRIDPEGRPYPPFHDVQLLVEGAPARALAEAARERWRRATGESLTPPEPPASAPWPPRVRPDLEDVDIAIARTEPAYGEHTEVREVECLHLDAIAAARRWIYVENQYLSSSIIGDALSARLREADGPEIVLVLPRRTGGWLEQTTMDVLRARLLRRLRAADRHRRLRVCYPVVPGLSDGTCISVHAKILIVDDHLLRVGSSNLSNRSLGIDTECDLVLEARDDGTVARGIAAFRSRLLAEHLGTSPEAVLLATRRHGSLVAALEELRGGARSLRNLEGGVTEALERALPDADLIDPERPLEPALLAARLVPGEERRPVRRRVAGGLLMLLAVLALAGAWRWSPLGAWIDVPGMLSAAGALGDSPAGPFIVAAAFVLAALVVFPVTPLVVATALVFGPFAGFLWSLAGCVLSAAATYGIGRAAGRRLVRRLAGRRINRLSRSLARRGITTVVTIRLLPVAPFTVVNMVAGASHIRFIDFVLGTCIGMIPGVLALTVFADRLQHAVAEPGPATAALLALELGVIAMAGLLVRRWLGGEKAPDGGSQRTAP